jgi:hypothetical protein
LPCESELGAPLDLRNHWSELLSVRAGEPLVTVVVRCSSLACGPDVAPPRSAFDRHTSIHRRRLSSAPAPPMVDRAWLHRKAERHSVDQGPRLRTLQSTAVPLVPAEQLNFHHFLPFATLPVDTLGTRSSTWADSGGAVVR